MGGVLSQIIILENQSAGEWGEYRKTETRPRRRKSAVLSSKKKERLESQVNVFGVPYHNNFVAIYKLQLCHPIWTHEASLSLKIFQIQSSIFPLTKNERKLN